MDFQYVGKAWRPFVPRIREKLRPESCPGALQPGSGAAPRVRRSWRTRLRKGSLVGRCDAHRVRLHPASDYAKRKTGRRPTQVSHRAHGGPVEERRAPAAKNIGSRRRHWTRDLMKKVTCDV